MEILKVCEKYNNLCKKNYRNNKWTTTCYESPRKLVIFLQKDLLNATVNDINELFKEYSFESQADRNKLEEVLKKNKTHCKNDRKIKVLY